MRSRQSSFSGMLLYFEGISETMVCFNSGVQKIEGYGGEYEQDLERFAEPV